LSDKNASPSAPSPLPWIIAGALSLLYLGGWLVGWGSGAPQPNLAPLPFLEIHDVVHRIVSPIAVSLLIFLSGASAGARLLRILAAEPPDPLSRLLLSTAVGLGVFAYATLALGSLGLLEAAAFWALAGVLLIAGYSPLRRTVADVLRAAHESAAAWKPFDWTLVVAAVVLILIGLLCVGTPILDYDSLEYHLGAPADYLAAGRVQFLHHNVYAAFPEHVEMLYLAGIVLSGGKIIGMAAAITTQLLFGVLAALAVGRIASRFLHANAGLPAAVFSLSCPMAIVIAAVGLVEQAFCFYTAVALLAALEWTYGEADPRARRGWIILAGLCCGLAVAVKYTALLLLCLPLGAAVLVVSLARDKSWRSRLAVPVLLALCALVAVLPWLVRNLAETGNPVFPLLYSAFGGHGWSAEQAVKFAHAHATPPVSSAAQLLQEIWQFLTGYTGPQSSGFAGPLAVVFIPFLLAPLMGKRGDATPVSKGSVHLFLRPAAFLLLFAILMTLLWAVATHRIARFLTPLLVILCALSAAGFCAAQAGNMAKAVRAAALALLLYGFYTQLSTADALGALGGTIRGESIGEFTRRTGMDKLTAYSDAVAWVNDPRNVPRGTTVMLVGEARVYYFDRPLRSSVVFNDHPIEPALELAESDLPAAVGRLRSTGASYVLVNWLELRRLAETYRFRYGAEERPGCLPQMNAVTREPLLFLLEGAGKKVASFGAMHWPSRNSPDTIPVVEIYKLSAP